ncbi:MAG: hypothetical protein FWE10_05570 [Rikenellaceae bacterium]|nr:hypothetical protein [Rikenellaceae bacterium]MCL2693342.1 hypothetical protein [Rikenellaceae bacterium]
MSVNKLILGDNLEILKGMESETVDLIYLDPPFFSNRNYEVIWGDEGEVRSFQDRWSGGIDHYIAWLKERVEQMHRVLKPTGSIFLHCDWHADAYIRVEILDRIFGYQNFRNEIIWSYTGNSVPKKCLPRKHDVIFWYSKGNNCQFYPNRILIPYSPLTEKRYNHIDKDGKRYKVSALKDGKQEIIFMKEGKYPDAVWGIPIIRGGESIGYPTQKPEALLKRIIECASNEGDVVLDPFVGGGTTVAVADKLNRKWIGIDQSVAAVKVTELRLDKQRDLFSDPFAVQLYKYDYDTLRYKNAFEFEEWIVQQFGGVSNTKQRGDLGLDGKMPDNTPIQVKRSDNVGRNVIDNFLSAVKRADKRLYDKNIEDRKPVGYIIAFSFGKGAVQEVARLKNQENIIIHLVKVEDIVPIAKKPALTVESKTVSRGEKGIWEIEFAAAGTSEAGIEFYSWDFDHNPENGFRADVMIDKAGRQTAKFKAGRHNIAVKVVDNDGLESIEVIKLKVNGTVERAE